MDISNRNAITLKRKRDSASKSSSKRKSAAYTRRSKTARKQKREIMLFLSSHSAQLCNNLAKNERIKGVNVKMLTFMTKYGDNSETCNDYYGNRNEEMDELGLNMAIRNVRNPAACIKSFPESEQPQIAERVKNNHMLAAMECMANVLHHSYTDYIGTKKWATDSVKEMYERGFSIVQPLKDKGYWFEPNEGERNYDPHYGLHILHVINPPHESFEHFNVNNYEKDLLDYGNISDTKKQKFAGITDIGKNIQIIRDAIGRITNVGVRNVCNAIYDSIVYKEQKSERIKDKNYDGERDDVNLNCLTLGSHSCCKLSELIYLFKYLGFTDIYLIDPACKGFLDEDCKSKTDTDKILKREIFTRQKIAQQLSPENLSISVADTPRSKPKSASKSRSKSKSASIKSPKQDFTLKGKTIFGIFYYEDEKNPDKLKLPDWNSEEGVPTSFGRVHSYNEYFKKRFKCDYEEGEKHPCKKSLLKKPKNYDEKIYTNEWDIRMEREDKMYHFKQKYRKFIDDGNIDEIPDKEPGK